MKKFRFLLAAAASLMLLVLLTGCKKERTLHIYTWEGYISEDVIKQFAEENNCKVEIDVFPSNEEMYAKLKVGATGYDIVVPSSYMATTMYKQQMIDKLDLSRLPNVLKYYDSKYDAISLDKAHEYTIPFFVSFTGIGYNSALIPDFVPSWKMFERSDLRGKISLLDDQREVIGAALLTLGFSANETNQKKIDEAVKLAREWKQNIAKWGVDDAKDSLASGEFVMIHAYNGDMLQVAMDNPDIKFVIPKEGTTITLDNFAILKDSKNKDLAYKFIDFMYRTDIAVRNINEIQYYMPHKEAVPKLDEALRDNPIFNVPADVFNRCHPLADLGEDHVKYDKAWDDIKK